MASPSRVLFFHVNMYQQNRKQYDPPTKQRNLTATRRDLYFVFLRRNCMEYGEAFDES